MSHLDWYAESAGRKESMCGLPIAGCEHRKKKRRIIKILNGKAGERGKQKGMRRGGTGSFLEKRGCSEHASGSIGREWREGAK